MSATCTWTIDTDSFGEVEVWETGCGNRFYLEADGPRANGFRFCPYCGRELVEVWPVVEEEE